MHSDDSSSHDEPSLVSNRTMDIVVALLLLLVCAIVIYDSTRLGYEWRENEGPASGYFPFYIAIILAFASLVNLLRALFSRGGDGSDSFVSKPAFMRVLAVLIPSFGFVAVVQFLGIYVASAIFIIGFMLILGRESIGRALIVGTFIPVALFFLFEVWFLVPLPKGPVEALIGY
nr:MAG: tripartite tricarboxylate transporter TctB family protein [Pseudomonadota bacterium]